MHNNMGRLIELGVYQYRCGTDGCLGAGPGELSFVEEKDGVIVFYCRLCREKTFVCFQCGCRRDLALIYDKKGGKI